MRIAIVRDTFNETETLGKLYLNGVRICETLELPWKDNAPQVSCIPAGNYKVVHRRSSKFSEHLHILDVPKRQWILIHAGNTHEDIKGCVLVGVDRGKLRGITAVLNSRLALGELLRLSKNATEITLDIQ